MTKNIVLDKTQQFISTLMWLYIILRIKPPIFTYLIYNDIRPIPIILAHFLKNRSLLFFGAILSHRTKQIPSYVNNNLFKTSRKLAQRLVKHIVQFEFE